MLKIFKSNTYAGAALAVYGQLKKDFGKGVKQILITPDRFTMQVEKGILDYLGIVGSFDVEVMSFARLAERALGNAINKCISPEGGVMLMRKVINDNNERLKGYYSKEQKEGLASQMFAVLSEIRNSGVTCEDILALSEKLPLRKRNKAEDILLLYHAYTEALLERFTDSTSRLEMLASFIRESTEFSSSRYYITDFDVFTVTQLGVIGALCATSLGVSVGLVTIGGGGNRRIFPTKALEALLTVARKEGVEVQQYSHIEKLGAVGEAISRQLFSYTRQPKRIKADNVRVAIAEDVESEIEYVAEGIVNEVRKEGLRYRDIAVVTSEAKDYRPVIEKVFSRYGIPFFLDDRKELVGEPIVRFILNVLDTVCARYENTAVEKLVASPFLGVANEEREIFLSYCTKYGINYTRFLSPFTIEEPLTAVAEKVRQRLIALLAPFDSEKKYAVSELTDLLRSLLNDVDADIRQKEIAEKQNAMPLARERSYQSPKKLNALLDTASEILKNDMVSPEDFATILRTGATHNVIAMIPQYLDSVFIGELAENRYDCLSSLYVIGAEEGRIPENSTDNGLLSLADAERWARENVFVSPTPRDKAVAIRFGLLQLLLKPKKNISVSYSVTAVNGKETKASVLISELLNIFDIEVKTVRGAKQPLTEASATLIAARTIRKFKDNYLNSEVLPQLDKLFYTLSQDKKEELLAAACELALQPIPNAGALFFARESTSISQIESYFSCPYRHFMQYGLRAKEVETSEAKANDIGSFIHEVLELFFKEYDFSGNESQARQKVGSVIDKVLNSDYVKWFDGIGKAQLKAICKEAEELALGLARALDHSSYKPYLMEVGFGGKGKYPAIELTGTGIRLQGKIDRIDKNGDNVLVIDYKTGNVEADLKYVYYGNKIQLMIYCYALEKQYKPKGAFYLQLKRRYVDRHDLSESPFVYEGVVMDNLNVAKEIDDRLTEKNKIPLLGLTIDKSGCLRSKRSMTAVSKEQFGGIIDYAVALVKQAVAEISDGYISPSPTEGACRYCPYTSACFDYDGGERYCENVTPQSFGLRECATDDGDFSGEGNNE